MLIWEFCNHYQLLQAGASTRINHNPDDAAAGRKKKDGGISDGTNQLRCGEELVDTVLTPTPQIAVCGIVFHPGPDGHLDIAKGADPESNRLRGVQKILEMDDRGMIPELSVWATNPW